MQNGERLVFGFQRFSNFLGRALGQHAIFKQPDDSADKFLVVVGELRATANLLCPQPFQNGRGMAVTMRQLGLLGLQTGRRMEIRLVLFEQPVELARNGLTNFLGVGGFQNFGGGEKINLASFGAGRRREEKLVELAPAKISEQRGMFFDGGISRQDSRRTGFLRQAFDTLEKFRVLVADFADFGEIFQFAFLVAVFAGDGFLGIQPREKTLRFDVLAVGQELGVRAQHFNEGVNLGLGRFAEFDEVVAFLGGEKVKCVNLVELGVHAVDAPDALNEARRIPWDVVIDDDMGTVEIHAFGQNFGGDENAEIILGMANFGVEIGDDFRADALMRDAGENEDFGCQLPWQSARPSIQPFLWIR